MYLSILTGIPSKVFIIHMKTIADLLPTTVNFALSSTSIHEDTTYIYFNHWQDWYNITLNGMYCIVLYIMSDCHSTSGNHNFPAIS